MNPRIFVTYVGSMNGRDAIGSTDIELSLGSAITKFEDIRAMQEAIAENCNVQNPVITFWRRFEDEEPAAAAEEAR